ncbi:MAG: histidine phosphatase family protein [Parvularculaceae bacterium]
MKLVSLLRHARAVGRSAGVRDLDRPLTARGREDASLMGAFLAAREQPPDLALCSPAARTRETLNAATDHFPEPPHAIFDDAIYAAAPATLLAAVQASPNQFGHVLLIGHNPGIHEFALGLAAASEEHAMARLEKKFPKGALAQFAFDVAAWRETNFAGGRLIAFARPKDLRSK